MEVGGEQACALQGQPFSFWYRPIALAIMRIVRGTEKRYFALGRTDEGRALFVALTMRGGVLRVVPHAKSV